jgi:methionyl-tRNA formyltransferase
LNYAILDGDTRYGSTFHRASERVDQGEILAVDEFEIESTLTYPQLSHLVSESLMRLIKQVGPLLFQEAEILPTGQWHWGEQRHFKSQLQADYLINSDTIKHLEPQHLARLVRAFGMSAELCQLRLVHEGQLLYYDPLRQLTPEKADWALHGHLFFKDSGAKPPR